MENNNNTGVDKAPVIPKEKTKKVAVKKAVVALKESKITQKKDVSQDKVSDELQEKANNFFKENPKAKEVFISADGFLFTNRNFACNHAGTLEVKSPFHFKNPATFEVVDQEE